MIQTKPLHTHDVITVNENNYDPTRTTGLRNLFAQQIRKRFRNLRGVIRQAIVEDDVFGLKGENITTQAEMTSPGSQAFNFPRSQDKVNEFMGWLNDQVNRGILEVGEGQQLGTAIDKAWTNKYITQSYQRGVKRGNTELSKAGYDVDSIDQQGGIDAVMNKPMHVDRLGVLYTRAFNELKGITDAMGQQISRVLAQGIADGDNPNLLANKLNSIIRGGGADLGLTDSLGRYIPAERRATILARTEIIRAHHQGTVQEYKNWRAEGVYIKAEWQTAGDQRVCARCQTKALAGTYTLKEIENLIPLHPQCRCIALPIKKEKRKR